MPDADDQSGPDLTEGITLADFGDGAMLRGHVGGEEVLLARLGDDDVVAVGATCTHYGGPLDEGLVVADTVRCPWHHACFSLRTGEALGAPAIDPVATWRVERQGDRFVVRERTEGGTSELSQESSRPDRVLIVGGGATGFACAEMLRRGGFTGAVTILSADANPPYDRPKLSKQFLAGAASPDELPLKPEAYYPDHDIELRLHTDVLSIDLPSGTAVDSEGASHEFDCLVLSTGAEPVELPIPGAEREHVFTLRTVEDSEAIIARAADARRAVILGSGFIGLETAASLTQRGVEVHVVTQDKLPLENILGAVLSHEVRAEHQRHGTTFHTETTLSRIDETRVVLDDGTELDADLVILGVGVTPRVELAKAAGLRVDDGVLVDQCLKASAARVYAGGDVARWEDARTGTTMRVEHWVVAERHGQHIARNILDGDTPFTDAPFFWSAHHDLSIRYVGHAEGWDDVHIDGDASAHDCVVSYRKDGRTVAVATLGRDVAALEWEAEFESASHDGS